MAEDISKDADTETVRVRSEDGSKSTQVEKRLSRETPLNDC
jgi:hypothetical protein